MPAAVINSLLIRLLYEMIYDEDLAENWKELQIRVLVRYAGKSTQQKKHTYIANYHTR